MCIYMALDGTVFAFSFLSLDVGQPWISATVLTCMELEANKTLYIAPKDLSVVWGGILFKRNIVHWVVEDSPGIFTSYV